MCKKVLHTIFRMPIINIIKATVTEKMIYHEKVVSCSKLKWFVVFNHGFFES